MSNGMEHKIGAAWSAGLAMLLDDFSSNGKISIEKGVAGAGVGLCLGTLPDIIEPATSPNHRKFFHSYGMVFCVGGATYKLYKWQPNTNEEKIIRFFGLAASVAYLTHLAMDSRTPKGLPVL